MSELTLSQLLTKAIDNSNQLMSSHSIQSAPNQLLLLATLSDLLLLDYLVNRLNILSSNELIEEVTTKDLRCLLLQSFLATLTTLRTTTTPTERIDNLTQAKSHFQRYLAQANQYQLIPIQQQASYAAPDPSNSNPASRRELKIAQYKQELKIKGVLNELRLRRTTKRPTSQEGDDGYYSDDDEDTISRPLFLNLLLVHYLRANSEIASIDMEMELLLHAVSLQSSTTATTTESTQGSATRGAERAREEEDESSWKIENLSLSDSSPLLSPSGQVLRPFTILPSRDASPLSARLRLQSEVFRSGHRLPTMTIDEFLDAEQAAGNVLQGGGPSTSEEVDQARRDEKGAKEEDNEWGRDVEESGLRKAREWDDYRDEHRKGEGNMHNRG